MNPIKTILAAAAATGALAAAVPANAVITTFAEFQSIGTAPTMYWKNSAANGTNGLDGSVYTIAAGSKVPGSVDVAFSFLQPGIAPAVTNVVANFTYAATETGNKAISVGGFLIQPGLTGTFSFLSTSVITVGSTTYGIGSNLLTASFSQAAIVGGSGGTSGSLSASSSNPALTISYTSDFLTFDPTASADFSLSLTAINAALFATPTKALRTFKALSTGSFSSGPAPLVNAVPEPAVWGLMIVGFGMIGIQSRRRVRNDSVAA